MKPILIYCIIAVVVVLVISYLYMTQSSEAYIDQPINVIAVDGNGNMSSVAVRPPSLSGVPPTSNLVYVNELGNIGVISFSDIYTSYLGNASYIVRNLLTIDANNNLSTIPSNNFGPPGAPTITSTTTLTADSVTVNWKPSTALTGATDSYTVTTYLKYSTDGKTVVRSQKYVNTGISASATSFTVSGLLPPTLTENGNAGEPYIFVVRAINTAGYTDSVDFVGQPQPAWVGTWTKTVTVYNSISPFSVEYPGNATGQTLIIGPTPTCSFVFNGREKQLPTWGYDPNLDTNTVKYKYRVNGSYVSYRVAPWTNNIQGDTSNPNMYFQQPITTTIPIRTDTKGYLAANYNTLSISAVFGRMEGYCCGYTRASF
jgi:hypothetical protein